jgi:Fur family ferric uptake transcriptional regulator
LRERGYRITPQREMILQAIAQSDRHISAEEVLVEVQKHTQAINVATVYRTLEMLWEEGLVCRNDLSEGRIVYATQKHGPHIHLVCRQCNRIIDADPNILKSLQEALHSQYKFVADLQHISIFGTCLECQA